MELVLNVMGTSLIFSMYKLKSSMRNLPQENVKSHSLDTVSTVKGLFAKMKVKVLLIILLCDVMRYDVMQWNICRNVW